MGIIKDIKRKKRKLMHKINWEKHKLSDWYYTYISKKTHVYDTPLGFKMCTRGYIANKLMVDSSFEVTERSILMQLIEKSDVFIDVGANIGYYTCLACFLDKKVLAFEPQQQNLACLIDNLHINNWSSRAEVFPIGLGENPGILTLFGASGPSASLINGWAGYSNRYKKMIPINTMDNILSGRNLDNTITIKIDVEGAEYNVLKGAIKTLNRTIKPIWFLEICLDEFHPNAFNINFEATFKLFFDAGYNVYIADTDKTPVSMVDIQNWVKNRSTGHPEFNYFFIPS
jgi:FkbM family methyltransferase